MAHSSRRRFKHRTPCCLLVPVLLASAAWAETVTIPAQKDNTLYEEPNGALSNGAGEYIYVGRNAQPTNFLRRGLLAFEIEGAIPLGAFLVRVTLSLNMSRTVAGAASVRLHRATANWGQGSSFAGGDRGGDGTGALPGDATWIHSFAPDVFWGNQGGDFSASESASLQVEGVGTYRWESRRMRDDLQHWLDNPLENFGWVLIGDETKILTSKRFDSRENPLVSNRPLLEVEYSLTPPPEEWLPGDCNADGVLDISDAVCVFGVLFTGVPSRLPCGSGSPEDPGNLALIDWQLDQVVDISDGIAMLLFLFNGGPPHPLAKPGEELTGCISSDKCPALSGSCR